MTNGRSYFVILTWILIGRGINPAEILLDAPEILPDPSGSPMTFDRIHSYYIGFNWSIAGDAVKLTGGYEYTACKKRWNGDWGGDTVFTEPSAHVSAVRARL